MVLHFNVTKDKRKAMVQAIEKEIGGKAKYLGVPSCAYEIGSFTVGKNGELEFGDFDDLDEVAQIVDACVLATGVSPAEWNNNEKGAEEPDRRTRQKNPTVSRIKGQKRARALDLRFPYHLKR